MAQSTDRDGVVCDVPRFLWQLGSIMRWAFFYSPASFFLAFHPGLKLLSLDRYGDFSCGVYIYSFPIQQTLSHQFQVTYPWTLFYFSLSFVMAIAVASWFLVEKPMRAQKGRLLILVGERRLRLARRPRSLSLMSLRRRGVIHHQDPAVAKEGREIAVATPY